MLITRLYLRNFRVYEDELDLEIPPGLVGIYGPNGAGKSALLEAILLTLWGKSRTTKDQVRSAGVGGECVTEVEFEHEGHLYLVRRTLKGVNSAVTVEAHCDGALMSTRHQGRRALRRVDPRDGRRGLPGFGVHRAEAAGCLLQSGAGREAPAGPAAARHHPARSGPRRRPQGCPAAGRTTTACGGCCRAGRTGNGGGRRRGPGGGGGKSRRRRAGGAPGGRAALGPGNRDWADLDRRRQEYDTLVAEGRGARQEMDSLVQLVDEQIRELAELEAVAAHLEDLDEAAAGAETRLGCSAPERWRRRRPPRSTSPRCPPSLSCLTRAPSRRRAGRPGRRASGGRPS